MYNASSINFYSVSWLAQSKVWQEICSMHWRFYTACMFCWYNFKHVTFVKKSPHRLCTLLQDRAVFFSTFHLQYFVRFCFHALICLLRNHRNGPWYTKVRHHAPVSFLILAWALILNVSLSAEIWLYVFWPLRQVCARKFHCVMLQIAVSTFGTRLCRCTCLCFSILLL